MKVCVITMHYGVGDHAVCSVHTRSSQFSLDKNVNFADQISAKIDAMTTDAEIFHDKKNIARGLGRILSHSVVVIDA